MSQSEQIIQIENPNEKSEDKKDIELEEREKILNAENAEKDPDDKTEARKSMEKIIIESSPGDKEKEKEKKDLKEGMEVKPKKIPIGGIQMPGFFTRSKSKEPCKDDGDQADKELIEHDSKDKEETKPSNGLKLNIRVPSLFRKSKALPDTERGAEEKPAGEKDKKKLLETIRLPLVSVFSKKKKDGDLNAQAGLASMETLDDKNHDDKDGAELKNVVLDDGEDGEKQRMEHSLGTWIHKLKTYRIAVSAILIFLLLIIVIIIVATRGSPMPTYQPIKDERFVQAVTSCGNVEGMLEDSSFAFRGIPYARQPLKDLRFKRAQPLNKVDYCWKGTLIAHNATPPCMQILGNGSVIGVEDCLTLDVVTPYVRYQEPLPVIVLIGADSFIGGSPGKMRPSARYARSRDVVFVRPNFRLGALGFLALETLSKSDYPYTSGNYGLSDILAALQWIQLNIEHFGGDKKSVTLFGHRAGATLVTALATMPDAKKYFARAWASSGGAIYPTKSLQESELENQSFLDAVQCKDANCLRQVDAKRLVLAVEDTWRKPNMDLPGKSEEPEKRHQWLVLDGVILKQHPAEVWANGDIPVDLVLGTTAHSGSSDKLLNRQVNWTDSLVRFHIKESYLGTRNLTDEILKLYQPTYKGLSKLVSDIRIVCPLFAIVSQMNHRVPFYVVLMTRGAEHLADVDSDIDAILGRYEPKTPEQKRYFSAMQGLFYHYIWHGKVEQNKPPGRKVILVDQDIGTNSTYSHCAYWISKDIVLPFAGLD